MRGLLLPFALWRRRQIFWAFARVARSSAAARMVGRLAPLARLTFAPHSHCAASSSSSSTATPISDSSTAALDSSGGLAFETLIPSSSAVERERGGVRVVVGEAHADVWFNDARSLVDPFEHASLKRDDVSMLLNQSEQGIGEGESLGRALKWDGVHKEHMGRWSLYFLGYVLKPLSSRVRSRSCVDEDGQCE